MAESVVNATLLLFPTLLDLDATKAASKSYHCPMESPLKHAVGATRAYFTPVLVIVGVLGNAATIVIFALEARLSRWNRFGIYCSALAAADAGVLLFSGLLDDFLGRGLMHAVGQWAAVKLDAMSSGSCKSLEFLQNYFLFLSTHLLLAFTLDRLLGVWRPLRFAVRSYVRQSLGVVAGLALAGLVLTAPAAAVYDVSAAEPEVEADTGDAGAPPPARSAWRSCRVDVSCNSSSHSRLATFAIYYKGFGIIVAPFLLQVCLSACLVARLLRIRRRRRRLLADSSDRHQRMELSRFYANLALSAASCLLAGPLCVAIAMRASCGLCSPRDNCRCRYLAQLTKLLDSLMDASFAASFWVYLACVGSFRKRVALAAAVVCVACCRVCGRSGGGAAWTPMGRRAEELLARVDQHRRPSAYYASWQLRQQKQQREQEQKEQQKQQNGTNGSGGDCSSSNNGAAAVEESAKAVEMQPLASSSTH